MGLDVFVMPLTAYLAGQFDSPLEKALGDAADNVKRVGNAKPDAPLEVARSRVKWIKKELSRISGTPLDWDDYGKIVVSEQFHYGSLQALRAFAADLEYPSARGKP